MMKIWFPLCLILIILIFLRIPKEASGLTTVFKPNNFVSSPSKLETFLNIIIGLFVLIFFCIVIVLDKTITI